MQLRVISLAAGTLFAAAALAQNKAVPHVIYVDGALFDVVYDVSGMQPTAKKKWWDTYVIKHDGPKVTASQNSQSLRMALSEIEGTPKTPSKWAIHRCLPNGGGIGGGQVSSVILGLDSLVIPTMDVAATQTAFFGIGFASTEVAFDGFFPTTPEEKLAIKAQKMWLPSNFRCKIGSLPAGRISKVDSFTIKQGVADFDGDGDLDFGVPGGITLTIPVDDAGPYREWFDATLSGSIELKDFVIELLDDDNVLIAQFSAPVAIESIGYTDLFLGISPTSGREVTIALRAKGIIVKKPGGGTGG